ncbi:MAG: hypothetical protein VW270_11105, partial [Candidatus Poseidoniales archaeon]
MGLVFVEEVLKHEAEDVFRPAYRRDESGRLMVRGPEYFRGLYQVVTVYANPATSSSSATNPRYSQSVLISKYSPFGNGVGELATVSCQWPGAGTL